VTVPAGGPRQVVRGVSVTGVGRAGWLGAGCAPGRPGWWGTWRWTSEQWGGGVLVRQDIPDGAGLGMADWSGVPA
jgi:hypothetical protein